MYSNTMYTQKIIDEFNVLRQQPEIIRNHGVRHMHKGTILCVERNEGGMVHSIKFH